MSFLGRLVGRAGGNSLSRGIALYEAGDYVGAAEVLRPLADADKPGSGSLIGFHLRQALVHQGRSLLGAGKAAEAVPWFAEVSERWPAFPDLQYWYALSLGHAGRWDEALQATRRALRFNGDYVEARVLEANALNELGDAEQAAASLSALIASGLRVEHPIIRYLSTLAPFHPDTVPGDLLDLLHDASGGQDSRLVVHEAVSLCRTGRWDAGIAKMRELCRVNPTYPDLRVKLAAALFQTGDNEEALSEVGQALILNPRYRTAAHLKALILADQHRFNEALSVVEIRPTATDPVVGHPGEELFCSYLSATLFLLTGRFEAAKSQLDHWHNLTTIFPMAQLLRAAVDGLSGDETSCLQRLRELVSAWDHDDTYAFDLAAYYLQVQDLDALEKHLLKHPIADVEGAPPLRQRYLATSLQLRRQTTLSADAIPSEVAEEPAWRLLQVQDLMMRRQWFEALGVLRELGGESETTETVARLVLRCYVELGETGDRPLPVATPDSVRQYEICLLHRQERDGRAMEMVRRLQELYPTDLRWTWLNPTFWLTPIRGWIG